MNKNYLYFYIASLEKEDQTCHSYDVFAGCADACIEKPVTFIVVDWPDGFGFGNIWSGLVVLLFCHRGV